MAQVVICISSTDRALVHLLGTVAVAADHTALTRCLRRRRDAIVMDESFSCHLVVLLLHDALPSVVQATLLRFVGLESQVDRLVHYFGKHTY